MGDMTNILSELVQEEVIQKCRSWYLDIQDTPHRLQRLQWHVRLINHQIPARVKNLEVSSKADDNWCDNGHYAKSQMVSVGKFCMIMESQQSQVQSTLPGEVLTGSQRQNRGGCRNWSNSEWLPLRKSLKKWGFQRDWWLLLWKKTVWVFQSFPNYSNTTERISGPSPPIEKPEWHPLESRDRNGGSRYDCPAVASNGVPCPRWRCALERCWT